MPCSSIRFSSCFIFLSCFLVPLFLRGHMLPPSRSIPIIEIGEILQQEAMDETVPTPTRRTRIRAVASLRKPCACQGKTCLLWSNQRKTQCRSTAHPPLTAQPNKPPPMAKSHTTLSASKSPLLSPSFTPYLPPPLTPSFTP